MMDIGSVLVTGGAGFIGSALARKLAHRSDRWVVLDSLHPQVHAGSARPADLVEEAELIVGDVTDPAAWDEVMTRVQPEIVIHLAAETGTAQSLDEASRHARVNVVGTTEMTDAFGRNGHTPRHVILSSSRAVYGEGDWVRSTGDVFQPGQRSHAQFEAGQWDFTEGTSLPSTAGRTVPSPTSVYGATKLAQENILRSWGAARGVPVSILRLQNVYGPGQSLINSYTGIVSLFSQLARAGHAIPLYEDGQIIRDFVFIDDIAEAFVSTVEAGPKLDRSILDIGSGTATTIMELAESITRYHRSPPPFVNGRYRDGDVRAASSSIDVASAELSWSPKWTLDGGIAALQEWIATQSTPGGAR